MAWREAIFSILSERFPRDESISAREDLGENASPDFDAQRDLPIILTNVAALISGGLVGLVKK